MSEYMDGYKAAVQARDGNCLVCHADLGYGAEWRKGKLRWLQGGQPVSPQSLEDTCWYIVEDSNEPQPPDGCELWPVELETFGSAYLDCVYRVQPSEGCEFLTHHLAGSSRFRGWGYVVDGELIVSAVSIAYTDGTHIFGNKTDRTNEVIRPDYAVMKKEADNE